MEFVAAFSILDHCILLFVSSYYSICVLILLYMCPHTQGRMEFVAVFSLLYHDANVPHAGVPNSMYVSACLYMCPHSSMVFSLVCHDANVPHAGVHVSSYYYICVLIPTICVLIAVF